MCVDEDNSVVLTVLVGAALGRGGQMGKSWNCNGRNNNNKKEKIKKYFKTCSAIFSNMKNSDRYNPQKQELSEVFANF